MSRVRVRIHDRMIDEFTLPGGMVYTFMDQATDTVVTLAREYAPRRSGDLAASVYKAVTPLPRRHWQGTIGARAPYALFVHEGTTGPIYARPAFGPDGKVRLMPVGKTQGVITAFTAPVDGQPSQPFLTRAMNDGLAAHGL